MRSMVRVTRQSRRFFYLIAIILSATPGMVMAFQVSGDVVGADGNALSGVMVTVIENDGARTTTRYTDSSGAFNIRNIPSSDVSVRARLVGFADANIEIPNLNQQSAIRIVLTKATRDELLQSLPASVWVERVKIEDPVHNHRFRIHCMGCHQQGNPATRWPKDYEQWMGVFDRMAHKSALVTPESRKAIANALLDAYDLKDGELPRVPDAPEGAALNSTVKEWRILKGDSWLHDSKVGKDGIVYSTDSTLGRLVALDPDTNDVQIYEFEDYDPQFKNFIGTSTKTYPHGLGVGPKGNIWILLGLDQSIAKFDVAEKKLTKRFKLPFGPSFPHTARFDDKGRLWFSLALSNQLGMFDTVTEEFEIVDLPTRNFNQWLASNAAPLVLWVITKYKFETSPDPEAMPLPYGVDVTPDGKVWVSQWNNAAIISYDPETEELKSYDTPFYGPRRLAADSKGNVWIPAWGEARIYKFDPATEKYQGYDLPTGSGSAAYTVDVHPQDDSVWVCGASSNTMMRFDPATEEFSVYPMPTRVTFCRDVDFDNEGNIWSNYSNFPTYHMEGGGIPGIVKIEP